MGLKERIQAEIESVGGRHDEPEVYGGDAGDPGLCGGPGSLSWEINGDLASVSGAGMVAIIMEVLHPSVMAGVSQQSTFRTEPLKRAQNTLGFVLRTTFGSTPAATEVIDRVRGIHGHINGVRPDGVAYRALEPDLIAWVHTCIPWAIMECFSRTRRPLSDAEKDQYLAEQAPVGLMSGADAVPTSLAELDAFVARMQPLMAMNEQTREFINFLAGDSDGPFRATPRQQFERRIDLAASMLLMPAWARQLTGTYQPELVARTVLVPRLHLQARLTRWAYPVLPCHTLAMARATGTRAAVAAA